MYAVPRCVCKIASLATISCVTLMTTWTICRIERNLLIHSSTYLLFIYVIFIDDIRSRSCHVILHLSYLHFLTLFDSMDFMHSPYFSNVYRIMSILMCTLFSPYHFRDEVRFRVATGHVMTHIDIIWGEQSVSSEKESLLRKVRLEKMIFSIV